MIFENSNVWFWSCPTISSSINSRKKGYKLHQWCQMYKNIGKSFFRDIRRNEQIFSKLHCILHGEKYIAIYLGKDYVSISLSLKRLIFPRQCQNTSCNLSKIVFCFSWIFCCVVGYFKTSASDFIFIALFPDAEIRHYRTSPSLIKIAHQMRVVMPNTSTESTLKNLSDMREATIAHFIRRLRSGSRSIMNEDYYTGDALLRECVNLHKWLQRKFVLLFDLKWKKWKINFIK